MGGCNGLRFIGTLDKSKVSGIIKITKAPSARTVWPLGKDPPRAAARGGFCIERGSLNVVVDDGGGLV